MRIDGVWEESQGNAATRLHFMIMELRFIAASVVSLYVNLDGLVPGGS